MRKKISFLFLLFSSSLVWSQAQDLAYALETGEITGETNVHHLAKYCGFCHHQRPNPGGPLHLKYGSDIKKTCICHYNDPKHMCHPYDLDPPEGFKKNMHSQFPLLDGKITCISCHDMKMVCKEQEYQLLGLRGAPYAHRTDFCFLCHARQAYTKFDPHIENLDKDGKIIAQKCLSCHLDKPDEKKDTFKSVKWIGDIELLCQGCHVVGEYHCGGSRHLIRPSESGLARIKRVEARFGIILPLNKMGKMTCVTCHNPHDKGVIPEDRPGSSGAGTKARLRLPNQLCAACHELDQVPTDPGERSKQ